MGKASRQSIRGLPRMRDRPRGVTFHIPLQQAPRMRGDRPGIGLAGARVWGLPHAGIDRIALPLKE